MTHLLSLACIPVLFLHTWYTHIYTVYQSSFVSCGVFLFRCDVYGCNCFILFHPDFFILFFCQIKNVRCAGVEERCSLASPVRLLRISVLQPLRLRPQRRPVSVFSGLRGRVKMSLPTAVQQQYIRTCLFLLVSLGARCIISV